MKSKFQPTRCDKKTNNTIYILKKIIKNFLIKNNSLKKAINQYIDQTQISSNDNKNRNQNRIFTPFSQNFETLLEYSPQIQPGNEGGIVNINTLKQFIIIYFDQNKNKQQKEKPLPTHQISEKCAEMYAFLLFIERKGIVKIKKGPTHWLPANEYVHSLQFLQQWTYSDIAIQYYVFMNTCWIRNDPERFKKFTGNDSMPKMSNNIIKMIKSIKKFVDEYVIWVQKSHEQIESSSTNISQSAQEELHDLLE